MGATDHDVIIAGAGPGGSTAAALLARAGHDVLVIEKDEFPRFHIGESLLPGCVPVLQRLEIEPDPDIFVYKAGADFVCEGSGRATRFDFKDALPGCAEAAWHVERARFDTLLRDRAVDWGADVRHGERVDSVDFDDDAVTVHGSLGSRRARYFVDATGQDRLLTRQHDSHEPFPHFGHAAVFTHFSGLSDAALEEIGPGGQIRIMMREDGWGWLIPLADRRLSVGIVCRGKVTPEVLDEGLLAGPLCQRLLVGAERGETRVIRNFSYRNSRPHGRRFASVGDAAGFLDPVFSSGVTIAMVGAARLADTLSPALAEGREDDPDLHDGHQPPMERAYATFSALIDRFYHSRFADSVLLGPPTENDMRFGVMSVLAGDVWREDNPFQEMLLKARPRATRDR